jgi:sigma-B regulation protein RsbU (phosphoserine phosphatase)
MRNFFINSISIKFALASVSVSLLVLAITGTMNHLLLEKELLKDAQEKAELIVENSRFQIDSLILHTQRVSEQLKESLKKSGYSPENIRSVITTALKHEPTFFGMAVAFNPGVIVKKPFSPYYYKKNEKIEYVDLSLHGYDYIHKEWYSIPAKAGKPVWSEPYFDEGGGNILMSTYSNPFFLKGQFAGIQTIDLSLEKLQEIVSSIHILDSGYAFLLSRKNLILVHPDSSKIMKKYPVKIIEHNKIIKEKKRWVYYAPILSTDFTLAIVMPSNELFASLNYMSLVSVVLAILGSVLLIITMLVISRRISRPLKQVVLLTDEISKGNFDKKIDVPETHDEIYQLSVAVNRMQDSIKQYIKDLQETTRKKERIEKELDIARSIQLSMLPEKIPDKGVAIEALLKPARAVGGDFYDFFYVDEKRICFVIADVSDKGVPAALFMAVTMSSIRSYSTTCSNPAEIVTTVNNTISENNKASMFVTLFLGIIDIETGKLDYVNAGHTTPYILTAKGELKKLKEKGNPVVGVFGGIKYSNRSILLNAKDKLFLFTDGVNEAFSKSDEQFGDKRLEELLEKLVTSSPLEIVDSVENTVKKFSQGREQSDDITILCIEIK